MGYNLEVGCHDCKVRAFAIRGEESALIASFAAWHSIYSTAHAILGTEIPRPARTDPRHAVELRADNGWSPRGDLPYAYTDVTDDLLVYREHEDLAAVAQWSLAGDGQLVATYDDFGDGLYTATGPTLSITLTRLSATVSHLLQL